MLARDIVEALMVIRMAEVLTVLNTLHTSMLISEPWRARLWMLQQLRSYPIHRINLQFRSKQKACYSEIIFSVYYLYVLYVLSISVHHFWYCVQCWWDFSRLANCFRCVHRNRNVKYLPRTVQCRNLNTFWPMPCLYLLALFGIDSYNAAGVVHIKNVIYTIIVRWCHGERARPSSSVHTAC